MKGISTCDIEDGLRSLGLAAGMAVEVHSSLGSFGRVVGGPQTVIHALMNVVGDEGTLVMTTFPISQELPLTDSDRERGITLKLKKLGPDTDERTGMGVISDTFKTLPGVVTGPGFFRVSAWGRGAEEYSKGLGKLVNENGWALLLGVDIHRLTAMHTQDENQPNEVTALFKPPEEVLAVYPADQWFVETGRPPEDAWGKIQAEADRRRLIRHGRIGECSCMLFRVGEVVGIYADALKNDPFGLYGIG